jgi:Rps23 Pro-64 3,4-dihydroxylase Tpa1-like proline 4-hydroxylase
MVMNKKELAPGIFVYSDVIESYSTLSSDIEEGMVSARIDWSPSSIKRGDTVKIDTDYRDTMTIHIPYNENIIENYSDLSDAFSSSLSNIFLSAFSPIEFDYKAEYSLDTVWHDGYSILKYGKGQKFINHVDDHKDYHRRISLVYYINDDYTGGEICFPRFGITYKPKANELLLFPSNYVYNHSVLPVVEGTRYAVVSWLR